MAKVQYYRGLNTDLDELYNSIKQLLQDQKDLRIVSEYKGFLNAVPLRSIVAVNKSPKVWVGSLRKTHEMRGVIPSRKLAQTQLSRSGCRSILPSMPVGFTKPLRLLCLVVCYSFMT